MVRRRTPRLPEPEGPRSGRAGSGTALRLLVAGDSSAAGVGAGTWDRTLTARLLARLSRRFAVEWRLEAATGATTLDTLRRLEALGGESFDVLVTALGVNDVTRGAEVEEWMALQRRLHALAREAMGVDLVVVSGLPPVGSFPALPWPLRSWLGRRARRFDAALRHHVGAHPWARFVDLHVSDDVADMAHDGFHPGPPIYAAWADRVAEGIMEWADSAMDSAFRLHTARLRLDPFHPGDTAALLALFRNPVVRRWLLDDGLVDEAWMDAEIAASAGRFAGGSAGLWSIREHGRDAVVGFVGFRDFFEPAQRQLLYGLHPDVHGRGYATEAAREAVRFAFERAGFERVVAAADTPHRASIEVMVRLGLRQVRRTDDGPYGTVFYGLERGAWAGRRGGGPGGGRPPWPPG